MSTQTLFQHTDPPPSDFQTFLRPWTIMYNMHDVASHRQKVWHCPLAFHISHNMYIPNWKNVCILLSRKQQETFLGKSLNLSTYLFLGKIKAIGENIVDTTFAFLGNECIGFANILIFSTTNLFVTSRNEFSNSRIQSAA